MLAVGFIPRLVGKGKSVALATVQAMGTSRNGSGVAEHKAALIQPSLTRRASDGASDRGIHPTANMKCPSETGEPMPNSSFPNLICVYRSGRRPGIVTVPDPRPEGSQECPVDFNHWIHRPSK